MTDDVPVSQADGPAARGAAQGTEAVSGAAARPVDPAVLGPAFPRTHHVLLLEFGDRADFDDPSREWRRLFSELLGTFALVLAAAGGGLLHAKGQISLAAAVVAPGLMVMAIILFMGAVSGAHLNPAVSVAFALRVRFPWRRVPGYILIQVIGATLACQFLRWDPISRAAGSGRLGEAASTARAELSQDAEQGKGVPPRTADPDAQRSG